MENYNKYLKYKNKYLKLKQSGGVNNIEIYKDNKTLKLNILDFFNREKKLKENINLSKCNDIKYNYDDIEIIIEYSYITIDNIIYKIKFKNTTPLEIKLYINDKWHNPLDFQKYAIEIFIQNNEQNMIFYNDLKYKKEYSYFFEDIQKEHYIPTNKYIPLRIFKIQKKYYIIKNDIKNEIRLKVKTICNIIRNINSNTNNISSIIRKFKNKKLNNIFKIYYNEMFNKDMILFLNNIDENLEIRNDINNSMKLFIYNYTDINHIFKSLIYRYPVYFGIAMHDYFNMNNLFNILGYTEENIKNEVDDICRYGILRKCYKINFSTFWMYHIWGINLETNNTEDYKIYYKDIIKKYNMINNEYYKMYKKILNSVYKAAESLLNNSNKVHIKFPLVGMGSFLNEITDLEIKKKLLINY
jgi:hypothetical protein